jgi:hypothetical protein
MLRKLLFLSVFAGMVMVSATSCSDEDSNPVSATLDISVGYKPVGNFTFFNFEKGQVVSGDTMIKTSEWDFGLEFISFIVNGGQGRVGQGGVVILDKTFEGVTEAPETGYKTDNGADTAIKNEWYTYNQATRSFAPIAGKVFVFKTAKGKYAKMEVLSALPTDDKGDVVVPPVEPTKIKYTIRYAFQPDGSRNF